MNVISQDVLKNAKDGQEVSGVILIKDYAVKVAKNGSKYIDGKVQSGMTMTFKVWSSTTSVVAQVLQDEDFTNVPCTITGRFNEYQGSMQLVVDSLYAVSGYSPEQFLEIRYNKDTYYTALVNLVSQLASDKGELAKAMLFDNPELLDGFKDEFAASNHHDNCLSGLLAHTYKMLYLFACALQIYPNICTDATGVVTGARRDLLVYGILLHDIGKVWEMNFGVYQPDSIVTHRILGLDVLYEHRERIISKYGERWYRELQAILVQHHGEFGDDCRTTSAFIVHQFDLIESKLTGLLQDMSDKVVESTVGKAVYYDGKYLSI